VLLLDTVSTRDASGAIRTPSPMDSFIPACDTERINALAAPTNRGG
jgi:copper-transporting P-type ATPase V